MNTDLDFAGEHRRQRNPGAQRTAEQIAADERPAEQPLRNVSAVGQTFFKMVDDLQAERNSLARDLNTANARIEQFQIAANATASEMETLRLQLQQTNDALSAEKAERIRLGNAIEMTIGTLQRSLAQPEPAATPSGYNQDN